MGVSFAQVSMVNENAVPEITFFIVLTVDQNEMAINNLDDDPVDSTNDCESVEIFNLVVEPVKRGEHVKHSVSNY